MSLKFRLSLLFAAMIVSLTSVAQRPAVCSLSDGFVSKSLQDTTLRVFSPFVRMEWDASSNFRPPYFVTQIVQSGDTALSAVSDAPFFVFDLSAENGKNSIICVTDASRKHGVRASVLYERSHAAVLPIALLCIFAVGVIVFAVLYVVKQKKRLDATRHELETSHVRQTRKFDFATVLFADIQGFTKIAETMDPAQLVDELDRYFIYFDDLVNKYGVEKIKTIGDAYMCAGGVPDIDSANPIEVVLVGLEMIEYVKERRERDGYWNMRVGINTGPVVSAQLGHLKKVFDIWGDSVNTASRMESGGEPGRVNISGSTYLKVQDFFECEYRGKMPVKYKGEVDMYFVNRLKPEYCQAGSTCKPNSLLLRKLQILKVSDFEQFVRDNVLRGLHENVSARLGQYLSRVRMLASLEGLSDDDIITVNVAAIFCFVQEEFPQERMLDRGSVEDLLRRLHISDSQKDAINRVVSHIAQFKMPDSVVEEIIVDSFNEVYGRKDIVAQLYAHYDDLATRGFRQTRDEWMNRQRRQLADFVYYTDSAKRLCEVPKKKQLEILDLIVA